MHDGVSTRTERVVGVTLVAGTAIASAFLWSSLPDAIAIHWDARAALVPIGYSWYLHEALKDAEDGPRAG